MVLCGYMSANTLRDEMILKLFADGKTPAAVADELGISEDYAFKRVKELLNSGDIFDTIESRKLLIYQLKSLYAQARNMLDTIASDKSWAQGVTALTNLIETTYNIRVKEETKSVEEIEAATRAQAAILIRAIEMGYQRARQLLIEENPTLSLEKADEAFKLGLASVLED